MARMLYRLGRFAARRRWAVLAIWLVALTGLGGTALAVHGTLADSFTIPGTQAQQAMDELAEKIPAAAGATGQMVFAVPQGRTVTEPVYQTAIAEALVGAADLPGVTSVYGPDQTGAISQDGRVAMAQLIFRGQLMEVPTETHDGLAHIAAAQSVDGMTINLSGAAVKQMPAIGSMEAVGVAVAVVVLLIMFGSIVAAGMPLITALVGVGVGMAGIFIVSAFVDMSSTAPILALMLGLAVGIDYALFIVSRHRQQLRAGMDVEESIGRATGTAGSAVVFAGITVVIALAALAIPGIPFLTIMGIAAAATVVMAVLIAITLVPAFLSFAGIRIIPRKHRAAVVASGAQTARGRHKLMTPPTAASDATTSGGGAAIEVRSNRWSRLVGKHPVATVVTSVAVLGVLAIPAFSLQLSLPDDGTAAPDTTQRQAYDLIADAFGPGAAGPLIVTVQPDDPAKVNTILYGAMQAVGKLDGVAAVVPAGVSPDGSMAMLQVTPTTGPIDPATEDLVHGIRAAAPDLGAKLHATVDVTGLTAMAIDVSEKLSDALPIYLAIVVGLALVLLLIVFRSIWVPIKAALGFLLTIAVSFGLVVAVYQWGWLGSLFGVHTPAPIISFLPIIMIGVLFGLAMDYEVFLVSGMRESWVHEGRFTGDSAASVRRGFSGGARVVTAAAIIMGSVFGGFIFAPDTIIGSIGFALALGVLVDAFVVRMTLVPAVMTLLGAKAWYLPKWLDRILPNVDIEGAALDAAVDERAEESALAL